MVHPVSALWVAKTTRATSQIAARLEGVVGREGIVSWREAGSVDTALALDGLGRFRLNAYKQMGEPALVMRRISTDKPMLSSL